jgi:ribonuclease-3
LADSREEMIDRCETLLGHKFADRALLKKAMTHASVASHYLESNERLEFLGDAVLGLVVCEELFRQFPTYTEGDLTRIKSAVVSRTTCARVASQLGIDELLFMSKGMDVEGVLPSSLAACALESLIAAVYFDGGFEAAEELILRLMRPEIDLVAHGGQDINYKSLLQQYAQRVLGLSPNYELLDEKGPDHSKAFEVAVIMDGRRYPSAWGLNKKESEQKAAQRALEELGEITASEENEEEQD